MKAFFLAFLFIVVSVYAQANTYDEGVKLYKNKSYAQAQVVFENLIANDKNNVELWYLLGLCQRVQNKLESAQYSQQQAVKLDPNNLNVHIELARLNLRLSNKQKAVSHVHQALNIDPNNVEVQKIQKQIKNSEQQVKKTTQQKKPLSYVGVGYEYSIISRASQPDWKKQEVFAGTWLKNNFHVHGNFANYNRFNNNQQHYGLGLLYVSPQDHAFDLSLNKGFSTVFLPLTRVRADLDFKVFLRKDRAISGLRFTLNGQYDQYENLQIGVIKPGVKILLNHGLDVHLQSILIIDENRDDMLYGIASRVNWFSSNNTWHIFTGVSFAPETDNAIVIDTSAFYVGGRYKFKSNVDLIVSYSHESRKRSFLRDIMSIYIRKNF